MTVTRCPRNPLITPRSIAPSRADFKVEGTFNAGAVDHGDETILLLRVAESVRSDDPNEVKVPIMEPDAYSEGNGCRLAIRSFFRDDPAYDFGDPRVVVLRDDPSSVFLTSLSHIRVARSRDGVEFEVEDHPFIQPTHRYERFGCEDPRVTLIEGRYVINYSSVSDLGITTSLAVTSDFRALEKLGLMFAPDNRDVCLFPERIGGYYWTLHRPAPAHFGRPGIWIARSPDLVHWGDHRSVLDASGTGWDRRKVGGGAPMLKTTKGWLQIYHGVDQAQRYCLGALLLDLHDPTQVIARMDQPLMEPVAAYERDGFFGNVVFTCGATIRGDTLHIYYGAADETIGLATVTLDQLWQGLAV